MIWTGRAIAVALILQTTELLFIEPWPWAVLSREIPRFLRPLLKSNRAILLLRLGAALAALAFPHPAVVAVLPVTSWALAVRWRGTFNGGSDALTFQILLAWLVSLTFPSLQTVCVYYVAVQLVLSYLVAGLSKLRNPQWRSGGALRTLLGSVGVALPLRRARALSVGLLLFECLFPLALWRPAPFVLVAVLFHLGNAYLFGLNRFFFAWAAAYPALFWVSAALFS